MQIGEEMVFVIGIASVIISIVTISVLMDRQMESMVKKVREDIAESEARKTVIPDWNEMQSDSQERLVRQPRGTSQGNQSQQSTGTSQMRQGQQVSKAAQDEVNH